MRTTDKLQSFLRVFEIPEFVKPWIDRFFEEIEIDLVMRLANRPLSRKEIIGALPAAAVSSDVHFRHLHPKRVGLQRHNQNQFNSMKIYAVAAASVAPVARKKQLR